MDKYADIRRIVIDASLKAQKSGLIKGTSGNISLRSSDGKVVAITPSSIPYHLLSIEDIPLVDYTGKIVEGHTRPSSELDMHLSILNNRPDCNAVIHTHSMFATIYAMTEKTLPPVTIPHMAHGISPTKVVPFKVPGSRELADAVVEGLGDRCKAVFMKNHGMVGIGKNMDDAFECAEYAEEAAQVACYSLMLGCLQTIPEGSLEEMERILKTGRAL